MALPKLEPSGESTNVQQTTLGLDVLSRFICNTWEEATADSEGIDVVVLGAGLYGGFCASKIYELSRSEFRKDKNGKTTPLRVLVLDAGPFIVPEHTQNIPNLGLFDPGIFSPVNSGSGVNFGTRNLVWGLGWRSNQPFVGQAYCVGGKGVYWGGWCPRLQEVDLKEWPEEVRNYLLEINNKKPVGKRPIDHYHPVSGALLARGEALTGYEALEYELGVVPEDDFLFDPAKISQDSETLVGLNKALLTFLTLSKNKIDARITQVLPAPIAVQTQSFISGLFALDKYSSVPALTASARTDHGDGRQNDLRFCVVPMTHAVKLECGEAGPESPAVGTRRVERIVVQTGGRTEKLQLGSHCQVVLAMSCIESTRLALESFSLESSLLKAPGQELMGRNFMVHLRSDLAFKIERARFAEFVSGHPEWEGMKLADLLQLASLHVQCEGEHGTYQYQLFAATNRNGPDANMYRMVPDADIQREIAEEFDAESISFVLRSSGEVKGGRQQPLRQQPYDFIDLAGDSDYDHDFNHRRAWVQFGSDHTGDPIWQEMHDTGHAIALALANGGKLEYGNVAGNHDFTLPSFRSQQGVGTTFHDSGTLWMGDNPDASVTDVNGHFHHVTNAYCADQAIFTTVGSANPVLTGLTLARKIADNIVSRHLSCNLDSAVLAGFTPVSFDAGQGWQSAPYYGIKIINDAIIETDPRNGIGVYYLPEVVKDFELYVEWKAFRVPDSPNAGILLRMPDPATVNFNDQGQVDAFYNACIEVQIDDLGKNYDRNRVPQSIYGDSRFKTGAIYGVAPARQWAATVPAPDGANTAERYWNVFQITCKDDLVTVRLNGKLVCEAHMPDHNNKQGFIGFQFHTGRVQFRNFQLKK